MRHDARGTPDRTTLKRIAAAAATVLLFLLAIFAIGRMLHAVHYRQVAAELEHLPAAKILAAIAATTASYLTLIGYDWSALRYVGARLAPAEVALASFCAHAIGNSSGSGVLFGGAVRFRLYAARGLTPGQVARIVSFCALGFGLGISLVGAAATALQPELLAAVSGLPAPDLRGAGLAIALAALAFTVTPFLRHRPLELGRFRLPVPSGWLMLGQLAVSVLDILFAGTALYVLLPAGTVSFSELLTVYAVALVAGVVSHVPGGLGVLEGLVIYALRGRLPLETLTAALLGYRVIYYVLPLIVGATTLAGLEVAQAKRSAAALSIARTIGGWASGLVPFFIAIMAFTAGVILLASGATPAAGWRLAILEQWVPLPLIHLSHFLASLAGVALLLLAHGLRRRLSAAYWMTAVLLAVNIVFALGKGLAYREAMLLATMLIVLVMCRRQFYRPSSVFQQTLTPGWWTAVIMAVGGSFLLGLFAFKHVEYAHDLWWEFALYEQAPRTMRAALGVLVFLAAVGLLQLLRPAPPRLAAPKPDELERAAAVIRAQDRADASLALMGDKALLFNEAGTAFVMFAVGGGARGARGGPPGPGGPRGA
ncbi:MAG: lysylphosphatidylglycerol synthetase family protein, partial [Rhodospirillaceae bacterium]|nr:lysylphosphatidylglycerol synthetase family protein [Rhodospirillaceae bacterium]